MVIEIEISELGLRVGLQAIRSYAQLLEHDIEGDYYSLSNKDGYWTTASDAKTLHDLLVRFLPEDKVKNNG